MAVFDWAAFFSFASTFIVVMGGGWFEVKRRQATEEIKRNTALTEETAARAETLMDAVHQIKVQTDGMSRHLEMVARREGVLEGISAADQASEKADYLARVAALNVAGKLEDLEKSGDIPTGALQDATIELQGLIAVLRDERRRKKIGIIE